MPPCNVVINERPKMVPKKKLFVKVNHTCRRYTKNAAACPVGSVPVYYAVGVDIGKKRKQSRWAIGIIKKGIYTVTCMAGKNHRSGKKSAGKHTTLIDAAISVYDYAVKIPSVSAVTAGQIKVNLPVAPHRVIIKELTGCLSVKVRGTRSIQELKIYSQDVGTVRIVLTQKFT